MKIHVAWQTGTPAVPDIYFVAIELGTYAGIFGLVNWDGEKWRYERPEEIIGFVTFNELKGKLDINWPKPEPVIPKDMVNPLLTDDCDDWQEVLDDDTP